MIPKAVRQEELTPTPETFEAIEQPINWKYQVMEMLCPFCDKPRLRGQVWSGVRTKEAPPLTPGGHRPNDVGYYEGHHGCVITVIGGEEAMRLMFAGQLGFIDPSTLVDGMVKE